MNSPSNQPILVTGATGFIGIHLVRRLIELGHPVSCLVRSTSRTAPLKAAGATLLTGDVTDRASVEKAMSNSPFAMVFHLAGVVRALNREGFIFTNRSGAENVASACARQSTPPVMLLVSSLAAAGPCSRNHDRTEADPAKPVSNYGQSKLAGEQVVAQFASSVPITIIRPPIVFGPGDEGVFQIFQPISQSGIHIVPRRGEERVSSIHVDDLVECLILSAARGERLSTSESSSPAPGYGIYYPAADETPTYAEFGLIIGRVLGKKARVVSVPAPIMKTVGFLGDVVSKITRKPGWVGADKVSDALAGSWTCASQKARMQLGWAPRRTLIDRLTQTADWYRREKWI